MTSNELIIINKLKNNNLNKKIIFIHTVICLFILFLILLYMFNNDYYFYYNSKGLVVDEHTVKLTINLNDKNKIIYNNNITINQKNYKYNIESISKDIAIDNEYNQYKDIYIDIKSIKLITNDIIDLKIKYKKIKLIKYIFKFVIGGS